jgi:hypothetical protein
MIDVILMGMLAVSGILWIISMYYANERINKIETSLQECLDTVGYMQPHIEDSKFYRDLAVKDVQELKDIVYPLQKDLSGLAETERRKMLHTKYKDMAARYAQLSKEYAK